VTLCVCWRAFTCVRVCGLRVYVQVFVRVYVSVSLCVCVCLHASECIFDFNQQHSRVCVSLSPVLSPSLSLSTCVCNYACARIHARMYACAYVCPSSPLNLLFLTSICWIMLYRTHEYTGISEFLNSTTCTCMCTHTLAHAHRHTACVCMHVCIFVSVSVSVSVSISVPVYIICSYEIKPLPLFCTHSRTQI